MFRLKDSSSCITLLVMYIDLYASLICWEKYNDRSIYKLSKLHIHRRGWYVSCWNAYLFRYIDLSTLSNISVMSASSVNSIVTDLISSKYIFSLLHSLSLMAKLKISVILMADGNIFKTSYLKREHIYNIVSNHQK